MGSRGHIILSVCWSFVIATLLVGCFEIEMTTTTPDDDATTENGTVSENGVSTNDGTTTDNGTTHSQAIVIDHTCTDLSQIPTEWINAAKDSLRLFYGHTSHGSQIISGMAAMNASPYNAHLGSERIPGSLSVVELDGVDLGNEGDLWWRDLTIDQLDSPNNDRNVVVWAWCGGVSDNTRSGINTYLQAMSQLERDYPHVFFVYMTGHLDGTGVNGNLNVRNNQIRSFCRANGKILFDFADIESYDPDGNYYLDRGADDNCDYLDGNTWRNWAQEWCRDNPGQCSGCECAHSQPLNCDLKARAFWWMLARIAGCDPDAD